MMKKKLAAMLCLAMSSVFAFSSCGGGGSKGSTGSTGGGSAEGMITEQALEIEGLDSKYKPDVANIKQQEGSIDVAILFEDAQAGWQALANEYERLHGGAVIVELNKTLTSSTYKDVLNTEAKDKNTKWDIVMGNLLTNQATCVNMYSEIRSKLNPYAGKNQRWVNVLNTEAWKTGSVGESSATYILNTENLQTAWFVNKTAMADAGVETLPTTWNELIDLCDKMQDAGYTQPLGISLDGESVDSNQFTWLLRVYGDYYYRNEYDKIVYTNEENPFKVDLTATDPESNTGYKIQETKFFNLILDKDSEYYVGAESAKYKDFLSQFKKMEPYLHEHVSSKSQSDLRNLFRTQSDGKASPQIILDYAGRGLSFANSDKIDMDFFDYPIMESEFVEEGTLLRDVGGSGGYLSILNHNSKQNELNLDFLKFVLSPYGQSIYYDALSKTEFSPNGITTVKNELVVVPEDWKTYFETDKISFTGLSDNNEFVRNFLRYLGSVDSTKLDCKIYWQQYLTGQIGTDTFAKNWHDSLIKGWKTYANQQHWDVDCYKVYGGPLTK